MPRRFTCNRRLMAWAVSVVLSGCVPASGPSNSTSSVVLPPDSAIPADGSPVDPPSVKPESETVSKEDLDAEAEDITDARPKTQADKRPERMILFARLGPILIDLRMTIDGRPHDEPMNELIALVLRLADTDGNAQPKWEELTHSSHFSDGQFGNLPIRSDRDRRQLIQLYDTDGDEIVDAEEVPRFVTRNRGGARTFSLRSDTDDGYTRGWESPIRQLVDRNQDNRISMSEIDGAPARLRSRDANDDGIIDLRELVDTPRETRGSRPQRRRGGVGHPVIARMINQDTDWQQLQYTIEEHYGDGATTRQRKLWNALWPDLDINNDGDWDVEEISGLSEIGFHLVLRINFEASPDPNATERPNGAAIVIDEFSESLVSLVHNQFEHQDHTVIALPDTVVEFRLNDLVAATDATAQAEALLAAYDGDRNGYLDPDELNENAQGAVGSFVAADGDGDGHVVTAEIVSAIQRRMAAAAGQIRAQVRLDEDPLFAALDANGDRRISPREIDRATHRIKTLDHDQDDHVDIEEIPAAFVIEFTRGATENQPVNVPVAVRQPIGVTKDEPIWFQHMDTNSDGDVSRREFVGAAELFDAMDSDGDGFVELAEVATEKLSD